MNTSHFTCSLSQGLRKKRTKRKNVVFFFKSASLGYLGEKTGKKKKEKDKDREDGGKIQDTGRKEKQVKENKDKKGTWMDGWMDKQKKRKRKMNKCQRRLELKEVK